MPARQELAPSPLESVVSMPRLGLRAYKGRALMPLRSLLRLPHRPAAQPCASSLPVPGAATRSRRPLSLVPLNSSEEKSPEPPGAPSAMAMEQLGGGRRLAHTRVPLDLLSDFPLSPDLPSH